MSEQSVRLLRESNPRTFGPAVLSGVATEQAAPDPSAGRREPLGRASFVNEVSGPVALLEVELPVTFSATERLRRALFTLRLQVVSSERGYTGDRVLYRLRVVEFDGAPIRETRRQSVPTGLLSLLDSSLAKRKP